MKFCIIQNVNTERSNTQKYFLRIELLSPYKSAAEECDATKHHTYTKSLYQKNITHHLYYLFSFKKRK